MKLRRILAGLWIALLLLVGTCYAENTDNPIIAEISEGYLRLNIPSVKKVEYYGRSYIECSYTQHHKVVLPYGIPIVEERGKYYCWFDPSDNKRWAFWEKHYDASKDYVWEYLTKKDISGDYLMIYRYLLNNFPKLSEEVIPQAVRINYENGTYKQQYEQLKAEVEAEQAAQRAQQQAALQEQQKATAIGGEVSPQSFPATLADEDIHEKYEIPSWTVMENPPGTISYESSLKTAQVHGKYILKCSDGNGFSFDYDGASRTYTIYKKNAVYWRLHCSPDFSTVTTEDNYGYTETYQYFNGSYGNLHEDFWPLVNHAFSEQDIGKHYKTPNYEWDLVLYPQQDYSHLPAMWYKLQPDPSDYRAFIYDKATGIFTMYGTKNDNGESIINAYATYKFLDLDHIENHDLETNETDIYKYDDGSVNYVSTKDPCYTISRFAGAGLRHFLQRMQKK